MRNTHGKNFSWGSYAQFFEMLGIDTWRLHESTSSAGDWVFILHINGSPHYAFQTNRYPYHGFTYRLGNHAPYKSLDDR